MQHNSISMLCILSSSHVLFSIARNYELDSACYYMRLLYFYWKQSPNGGTFDGVLRLQSVQEAVEIMVDLWIAEQEHELDKYPTGMVDYLSVWIFTEMQNTQCNHSFFQQQDHSLTV